MVQEAWRRQGIVFGQIVREAAAAEERPSRIVCRCSSQAADVVQPDSPTREYPQHPEPVTAGVPEAFVERQLPLPAITLPRRGYWLRARVQLDEEAQRWPTRREQREGAVRVETLAVRLQAEIILGVEIRQGEAGEDGREFCVYAKIAEGPSVVLARKPDVRRAPGQRAVHTMDQTTTFGRKHVIIQNGRFRRGVRAAAEKAGLRKEL